jgi:cell division septum initiation protein DivIVA
MSNTAPSAVDVSDVEHPHETVEELARAVEQLQAQNEQLVNRVTELETSLEQAEDRAQSLKDENRTLRKEVDQLTALTEAARNRTGANKSRIEELQARELEKGAHLQESNVDAHELELDADYLERLTKSDGHAYYRLPDSDDPLDRTDTKLAHGDLLPIQQLARLDEDMRRSTTNSLPTRLAAKLWKARTDSTIGDDPWETGCKNVREYVNAGDLKHWIRRQEDGVSDSYAKKLVSRTIDALLELSKHRLAVHRKTQRKNGLSYTERRLVLPTDADVPGEPPRHRRQPTSTENPEPTSIARALHPTTTLKRARTR